MLTYVKLQATSSASDSVQLLPYAHEPVPPASFHLPDAPRKNRSVVPCWYTGIRPLHSTTSALPPDFHRLHAPVIHLVVVYDQPFHLYASSGRTEKTVQSHNRELHRICITSSIRKKYCWEVLGNKPKKPRQIHRKNHWACCCLKALQHTHLDVPEADNRFPGSNPYGAAGYKPHSALQQLYDTVHCASEKQCRISSRKW